MPDKTLVLIFQNTAGDKVRISISDVKDGVTDAEVKTSMETFISKNIFDTSGGDLVSIAGAEIVTRTVQELTVR
jgi:hypothetical protein